MKKLKKYIKSLFENKQAKNAILGLFAVCLICLVGAIVLLVQYQQKSSEYDSLSSEKADLESKLVEESLESDEEYEGAKGYYQEQIDELEDEIDLVNEEIGALELDKESLENQNENLAEKASEYQSSIESMKKYYEFADYLIALINTAGSFDGMTEDDYNKVYEKAVLCEDTKLTAALEEAWESDEEDGAYRLAIVMNAVFEGVEVYL